ncbi:MAG: hypothetical protein Crog4KO_22940 [Crocinitomicaceae bacterium]
MKKYSTIEDLELLSESALDSALAGFWDWNMVTNEEYLSPRFKEMFGYRDHEMENSPEAWQKIAYQEDLPGMFESFNAHVGSGGKVPFHSVVRYHHKKGGTVWVRCNGKVVEWGDDGSPIRAIGCHVDITEEKEMQLQLKRAIRERDILLKEVHHRVKNNLQLLLSLSRLKNKGGKIEVHEIEDSINSMARAYEGIYQSDDLDNISIDTYIDQIVQPIISGANISFDLQGDHFEQGIDFLIPIGLIITELVNNSMKHGRDNGGPLSISIKVEVSDKKLICRYHDNGPGYTAEVLNGLENTETFGVSIILGLIEQLGGGIKFYDKNGACADILIRL